MSQSADTPPIIVERDDAGIVTLTLNRPDARNVLSRQMLADFAGVLDGIAGDDEARVVLLRAKGPGFSAGHDLREIKAHQQDADGGEAYNAELFASCAKVMGQIRALSQPVIAVVQATAVAAGCELVATCDMAIASETARFGVNGINIGLFCSSPAVALARNVTRKRAFELLSTGRLIDAAEALEIGLVNRVTPPDALDEEARSLAAGIAEKPAAAVAIGKQTFYRQVGLPVDEAYPVAGSAMVANLELDVAREGIAAFTEKRAPDWKRN